LEDSVRPIRRILPPLIAFLLLTGLLSASPAPVASAARESDRVPGSFIVELAKGVSISQASKIASAHGGRVADTYDQLGSFAFTGSDSAKAALGADRRVAAVESDRLIHAVTDPFPNVSHLSRTRSYQAYDAGYTGTGVSIAIIDTGVTRRHRTFHAGQVVSGKNCVGSRGTPDGQGHGTHVASSAAGLLGVAHDATIVPVKVFAGASLSTPISRVVCGLNWVTRANRAVPGTIDVVNMSLAYSGGSATLKRAVANARVSGAIVVAAAGNNGGGTMYPARYPGVVAVSALAGGNRMASFSSSGGTLTAPGVNIKGAENGAGYSRRTGTSHSSPMAAGAVAVVLAESPASTPQEVIEILWTSGTCPNGNVNGSPGFCSTRWRGDRDHRPEPLINAYCAGILADPDPLAVDVPTCGF
jgi:subtilisin family serine protease